MLAIIILVVVTIGEKPYCVIDTNDNVYWQWWWPTVAVADDDYWMVMPLWLVTIYSIIRRYSIQTAIIRLFGRIMKNDSVLTLMMTDIDMWGPIIYGREIWRGIDIYYWWWLRRVSVWYYYLVLILLCVTLIVFGNYSGIILTYYDDGI